MTVITRFAPSPTGYLHLGHIHAALVARGAGDRMLLRLEDIDTQRCRPIYAAAILDDLRWLGIAWDGPVRVQTEHLPEYRAALDELIARGLAYPCFCSRADIEAAGAAPHGPDGLVYPGICRHLPSATRAERLTTEKHAWRLDMAAALRVAPGLARDPSLFGDIVIERRDTPGSYHLCSAHDDAMQGVTLVTRGLDLAPARALHELLQALFGWPHPDYRHFPLLTDADGRRLSKRDDATSIRALRAAGHSPETIRAMAGLP
jgi:glutamyl-Q tRNA(Asp) synthetase